MLRIPRVFEISGEQQMRQIIFEKQERWIGDDMEDDDDKTLAVLSLFRLRLLVDLPLHTTWSHQQVLLTRTWRRRSKCSS
jgi:hypothetical protein